MVWPLKFKKISFLNPQNVLLFYDRFKIRVTNRTGHIINPILSLNVTDVKLFQFDS
jgi:hypothetical protein